MSKLFSYAASSTRALPTVAVACLLVTSAQAAQGDRATATLPAPFAHYQNWGERPVADWRAANARVGEIGGWRTYSRESASELGEVDAPHRMHDGEGDE